MSTSWLVLVPLAAKTPDPADVKPGWLGFAVFCALAVAVVLLWLSMRRHLGKIDFEEQPDEPPTDGPTHGQSDGREDRRSGPGSAGAPQA